VSSFLWIDHQRVMCVQSGGENSGRVCNCHAGVHGEEESMRSDCGMYINDRGG